MEAIKLNGIRKSGNRAVYSVSFPEDVKKVLRSNDDFFIELPDDKSIENIPDSVLTIPFVGTMLGIAMCFDCDIEVDALDKEYFEDVKELLNEYRKMYTKATFNVNVKAKSIENNVAAVQEGDACSVFFTGGVDATSAMIGVESKKPILINIWGGDVPFDDHNYHSQFTQYLEELKSKTNVSDYTFIKSNCRILLVEQKIDKLYRKKIDRKDYHGYWSSIAHIVAMTSIMAPYVYLTGIKNHYIGSSYKAEGKVFRGDGNSEEIISKIHYLGCKFIPQDSDITRVQKAERIVKYQEGRDDSILDLRVCWYRNELGRNCSCCEKCMRTIMEIAANGGDPNKFGFEVDEAKYRYIKDYLENNVVNKAFWESTKECFVNNSGKIALDKNLDWMKDIKFNTVNAYYHTVIKRIKKKIAK